MTGGVALQAIITGLAEGAVYGLIALGFTLVWRLTRVFALAHGDVVVGGVFVAVLVVLGSTPIAVAPGAGDAFALVALVLLAAAALSAMVYGLAVRPFLGVARSSDVLGWVVAGLAAGLAIRECVGLVFSAQAYAVPDPLHLASFTDDGVVQLPGNSTVPVRTFAVIVIALVVAFVVQRFVVHGNAGRALRAVSDDPEAAALVGVPVQRLLLYAFVVAGSLAGLAGLLDAPGRSLSVDAGVVLGLKGALAAFVGRLGSLPGAVGAGLLLGVAESLAVAWPTLGAAYADVLLLGLLLVVIALRPEGLGAPVRESVE